RTYADIPDHDHDLGRGDSDPMMGEGKPGPRPLEQTVLWGMALERGDCRRDGLEWGILWMNGVLLLACCFLSSAGFAAVARFACCFAGWGCRVEGVCLPFFVGLADRVGG